MGLCLRLVTRPGLPSGDRVLFWVHGEVCLGEAVPSSREDNGATLPTVTPRGWSISTLARILFRQVEHLPGRPARRPDTGKRFREGVV